MKKVLSLPTKFNPFRKIRNYRFLIREPFESVGRYLFIINGSVGGAWSILGSQMCPSQADYIVIDVLYFIKTNMLLSIKRYLYYWWHYKSPSLFIDFIVHSVQVVNGICRVL